VSVKILTRALIVAAVLASSSAAAQSKLEPPKRIDSTPVAYPVGGHGDASVTLTIVVDAEGLVREVQVTRGDPPFAQAAEIGVRSFRFVPATKDDLPIAARITAVVEFHDPSAPKSPSTSSAANASLPPATTPPSEPSAAPPLAPSAAASLPVQVTVRGRSRDPGGEHVSPADARFIPGAFGDPFRVIEALPGMAPWVSGLPYYFVRGLPPENVGYFIDGIRVPLLFHVGAGPSILAPPLVDSVDLYAGDYPARYGRYAGAVVAGETTAPVTDRPRVEVAARVFDARAFGETPYDNGQGSVLAAARYGYTNLVISLVAPKYRVSYWDYQSRVSHRVWGNDTVSIFAFGARDELTYLGQKTFHGEFHRVDLRYDHPLEDGNLRVAATFGSDDTFTALQTSTGAGENAALRGPSGRLRAELDEALGATLRIRAGADVAAVRFDVDEINVTAQPAHTDLEMAGYADAVFRPFRGVELVPGFRMDAYRTRGNAVLAPQPRLAAKVRIAPRLSWISTVGIAHQEPTEEVFVPAKLPDSIDDASRDAFHLSEGLEAALPWSLRARVTGFASHLEARGFSGAQRTEGLELFVQRSFLENLNGLVSYTLSRSDTLLARDSHESVWDRTHILTTALGYDLGAGWRVGGRFFFESGRLSQVSCPTADCAPGQLGPANYVVTRRLPPFYRGDARLERRLTFANGRWLNIVWECFNVLAGTEPTGYDYFPASGLTLHRQGVLIFPSFGLEGGF
jgi:hypothetical protein